ASVTAAVPAVADTPLDSVWYNASENGRGYSVEIDNATQKLFLGIYAYSSSGLNEWYISQGAINTPDNYTGRLQRCTGGQTLGGTYRAPTCSDAGAVSLSFSQNNGSYA